MFFIRIIYATGIVINYDLKVKFIFLTLFSKYLRLILLREVAKIKYRQLIEINQRQ